MMLRRDAAPLVAPREAGGASVRFGGQRHTLLADGELDRVREQIRQYLQRAVAVGTDRRQALGERQLDADAAASRKRRDPLGGNATQFNWVERCALQPDGALFDL